MLYASLVRPHVPSDLEYVAETGGGDKADPSASPFENQVRRQRGAVNRPHDVLRPGPGLVRAETSPLTTPSTGILRGGQDLAGKRTDAGRPAQYHVGESPSDIDSRVVVARARSISPSLPRPARLVGDRRPPTSLDRR